MERLGELEAGDLPGRIGTGTPSSENLLSGVCSQPSRGFRGQGMNIGVRAL